MRNLKRLIKVNHQRICTIEIPEEFGNEVEIIIQPVSKTSDLNKTTAEAEDNLRIQSKKGFLHEILNDPKEDIWNDL